MQVWPLTLKIDMATRPFIKFLNSTCDIEIIDMQPGFQKDSDIYGTGLFLKFDMRHGHKIGNRDMQNWHFLKSTGDLGSPCQGPHRCQRVISVVFEVVVSGVPGTVVSGVVFM